MYRIWINRFCRSSSDHDLHSDLFRRKLLELNNIWSIFMNQRCLLCGMIRPMFTLGNLICTLISENQGLDKLRSLSNLRKISVPAHLNFFSVHLSFFSVCHLSFFQNLYHRYEKNSGDKLKENSGLQELKFFLRFEADLDLIFRNQGTD